MAESVQVSEFGSDLAAGRGLRCCYPETAESDLASLRRGGRGSRRLMTPLASCLRPMKMPSRFRIDYKCTAIQFAARSR